MAGANQRWEEPRPWGEAVGVQRLNIGSRMSREAHVRFWERVGVRFPYATRPIDAWRAEPRTAADSVDRFLGDGTYDRTGVYTGSV